MEVQSGEERAVQPEGGHPLRAIFDDLPVMIWVTDAEGNTVAHNRSWTEATGQPAVAATGFGWLDSVHPDDRIWSRDAFLAANAERKPVRIEYRQRRADGRWAWVIDTGRPRFAEDGRFLGYVGCVLDITERHQAEQALRLSEAFSRSVLESSPNCIKVLDRTRRLIYMNDAGYRLLDLDPGRPMSGKTWPDAIPGGEDIDATAAIAEAEAGRIGRKTMTRRWPNGGRQWLEVSITKIDSPFDSDAAFLVISTDVTESHELRTLTQQTADRLSMVLESTTDCVMMFDGRGRLVYSNGNALRAFGAETLRPGAGLSDIFAPGTDSHLGDHLERAAALQRPVVFEEHVATLDCWFEVHLHPSGETTTLFLRNITARRRAERERALAQERIAYLARHDELTGLANRVLFGEALEAALARDCPPQHSALLAIDLDGFKVVNDTLGHPAGDALLREVAQRLRRCVRDTDLVARLGGDEFEVIQRDIAEVGDVERLARRILAALGRPIDLDGHQAAITASIGIALIPDHGATATTLMQAADIALYRAKLDGRGLHRVFHAEMDVLLRERQSLKLELLNALGRSEFELHYQPLVNLRTGTIMGFEALLRWRHPMRGLVSPAAFIPISEETGVIKVVTEWILRQACAEAMHWPADTYVSVNLSPIQFRGNDLYDKVVEILAASGLAPWRLQLEITETVLLQDNGFHLDDLPRLRQLGVQIAMDDFGTGYSSLSYLRTFPFDRLKLDQSFIRDLPGGVESTAIVRAVAELGKGLGIALTAEGIETVAQLTALRDQGYEDGQGYLFSRPVDAVTARRLITARIVPGWPPAADDRALPAA